ncbi:hypothetical protein HMI54_010521 [Coelomomyces lativittatus]|nr:hypothetical protein HMI54_010521 [Coelomomyces lativittatus]KAJ1512413.1 hypothetical protein HMI56_004097 [Coelomomyces lativittatus]KAJ1515607.1 hypothetical protein HMI55_003502 [Coelomomyces lativittatus]
MQVIDDLVCLLGFHQRWQWTTIPATSHQPAFIADAPAEYITIFSQPTPQNPIPLSTCHCYWRQEKESGHWLIRIEHHHTVFCLDNLSNNIEENEQLSLRIEKMISFVILNKIKTGHWWQNQLIKMALIKNN